MSRLWPSWRPKCRPAYSVTSMGTSRSKVSRTSRAPRTDIGTRTPVTACTASAAACVGRRRCDRSAAQFPSRTLSSATKGMNTVGGAEIVKAGTPTMSPPSLRRSPATVSRRPLAMNTGSPGGCQKRTVRPVVRSDRSAGEKTRISDSGNIDAAMSLSPSTWLVSAMMGGWRERIDAATESSRSPGRVVSTRRSHASEPSSPQPTMGTRRTVSCPKELTRRGYAAPRVVGTASGVAQASRPSTAPRGEPSERETTTASCRSPNSAAAAIPIAPAPWNTTFMLRSPVNRSCPRRPVARHRVDKSVGDGRDSFSASGQTERIARCPGH